MDKKWANIRANVLYSPSLPLQARKSQEKGTLSFLKEVEDGAGGAELRAAHAETIQELQKTRNLLSMESKICKDYKVQAE